MIQKTKKWSSSKLHSREISWEEGGYKIKVTFHMFGKKVLYGSTIESETTEIRLPLSESKQELFQRIITVFQSVVFFGTVADIQTAGLKVESISMFPTITFIELEGVD